MYIFVQICRQYAYYYAGSRDELTKTVLPFCFTVDAGKLQSSQFQHEQQQWGKATSHPNESIVPCVPSKLLSSLQNVIAIFSR